MQVNLRRLQQGLQFYARGIQLLGQDLQLLVNMLTRAITKGYTLRSREVQARKRALRLPSPLPASIETAREMRYLRRSCYFATRD